MEIKNKLLYRSFVNRENELVRAPYLPELAFYKAIQKGNLSEVRLLCSESIIEKEGLGLLSENTLQSMKYHFVITVALIARYCIEAGLAYTEAFDLSDYYIQTADHCQSIGEIGRLHTKMSEDYTKRMQRILKERIYSQHIVKCVDYIYDHLHTKIMLSTLADYVELDPAYLSRLFKKEMGMSVSSFILDKKLETAQSMLAFSDYPIAEIASVLAFASQSNFTEKFKQKSGMTPLQYRNYHSRDLEV